MNQELNREQLERLERYEAQRMKRNAYIRQYRAAHPDKVQQWRINHALNVSARVLDGKGGEDA